MLSRGLPRSVGLRSVSSLRPTAVRLDKMERTGLCMGCHQNMTNEELWSKVNSPAFVSNEEHQAVMDQAVHALSEKKSAPKE